MREGDWVKRKMSPNTTFYGFIQHIYPFTPHNCNMVVTRVVSNGIERPLFRPETLYDIPLIQLCPLDNQLHREDIDDLINWALDDGDQEAFNYYSALKVKK